MIGRIAGVLMVCLGLTLLMASSATEAGCCDVVEPPPPAPGAPGSGGSGTPGLSSPTITSISVDDGTQGLTTPTTVTTTITGTNLAGATSANFGTGISVSLGANTGTSLTVTLTIFANVALGPRAFSVSTGGGTASSGNLKFTVLPPGPTINSLSVSAGIQGAAVTTTITGTNLAGATGADFGAGIGVALGANGDTSLTVTLTIGAGAGVGPRAFSVTTPSGTGSSGSVKFTVSAPAPTLTALSVGSGIQGATVTTTITGTNLAGATGADFGAGIGVALGANGDTSLTVTLTIGAGASVGPRAFSVTTPSGTASSGSLTFTVFAALAGVRRSVAIAALDSTTQRGVGQSLAQLFRSAGAEATVTQAADSGVLAVQTAEGRQFAFLPLSVRTGTALERAAAPSLTFDPLVGVGALVTPQGSQVEIMGSPPDLAGFLALLAPLGVRGLTIERGYMTLQTADPNLTAIMRFDVELAPASGAPGFQARPNGMGQFTYPGAGGRTQAAFPVFADLSGLLDYVRPLPGVSGLQSSADGTVQLTLGGQALRLRPGFLVIGPTSPGAVRQIVSNGSDSFTFTGGDGRRQSCTLTR